MNILEGAAERHCQIEYDSHGVEYEVISVDTKAINLSI